MNYRKYFDELLSEVSDLISQPNEGEYWDFKREWYFMDKKANPARAKRGRQDLLLDILNMANNPLFKDAFIIIGVDDKTHEVIGVPDDDTNRRTTEQLTDFLAEQKFANEIYPKVQVETLTHNGRKIDVIVIKSSRNVPFYLYESREDNVRAGVVYARQNGRNTPRDKSASSYAIERLWKHRFLLDATPYEHFLNALEDRSAWASSSEQGATERDYLKIAPEYTISCRSSDDNQHEQHPEFYCCNQYDTKVSYFSIIGRYHQTVLFERQGVYLDGMRYRTSTPDWGFLSNPDRSRDSESYKYYVRGSENWLLHRYLLDEQSEEALSAHRRFMENILVYETESERVSFEEFVKNSWEHYERLKNIASPFIPEDFDECTQMTFDNQLRTTCALKQLLDRWRTGRTRDFSDEYVCEE